MDDEKIKNTRPATSPSESGTTRPGTGEGSRPSAAGGRRRPAHNHSNQQRVPRSDASSRQDPASDITPREPSAGAASGDTKFESAGNAHVTPPAKTSHTVWSSDRRRGGRMPIPAGSVAGAAAQADRKPAAGAARSEVRRDGKPAADKFSDRVAPDKSAGNRQPDRTSASTDKKEKNGGMQRPTDRSTGRPTRVPHRAARAEELPRMDNLLIDDTPAEPDVSPDAYSPSESDIERILSYEPYIPCNRQIPDILPEGKTVIVGVRFRPGGKTYFFAPGKTHCRNGQAAIVETARGLEFGEICMGNRMVDTSLVVQPLRPLVRLATEEDIRHNQQNREREAEAYRIGVEKIRAHKLDMKLVAAQYTFDNAKLLFYFTSDGRVDFRELVKDLASVFRIRIELRQIGIRDEARMIGGLGPCGRPLCCSTFLSDFGQVSMKMAKEQNLSLNASKISGCCGRLMCCLRYEHETYQEEFRRSPAPGSLVQTPDGAGVVTEVLPILGEVKVSLRNQTDSAPRRYKREVVSLLQPESSHADTRSEREYSEGRTGRDMRPTGGAPNDSPRSNRNTQNTRPAGGTPSSSQDTPEDDLLSSDEAIAPAQPNLLPDAPEADTEE